MSSLKSSDILVTRAIASLLFLDWSMKSLMTMLRIHGAPGQGQSSSFFEKASRMQLLTAEYTGPMAALIIAHKLKRSDLSDSVKVLIQAMIASRYIFALRMFDFSVDASGYKDGKPIPNLFYVFDLSIPGALGATLSYITYALLLADLVKE